MTAPIYWKIEAGDERATVESFDGVSTVEITPTYDETRVEIGVARMFVTKRRVRLYIGPNLIADEAISEHLPDPGIVGGGSFDG